MDLPAPRVVIITGHYRAARICHFSQPSQVIQRVEIPTLSSARDLSLAFRKKALAHPAHRIALFTHKGATPDQLLVVHRVAALFFYNARTPAEPVIAELAAM